VHGELLRQHVLQIHNDFCPVVQLHNSVTARPAQELVALLHPGIMKKLLIAAAVLMALVIGALLASRDKQPVVADFGITEEGSSSATGGSAGTPTEQSPAGHNSRITLSRELLESAANAPNEAQKASAWAARARDRYYEKLLVKKRDQAKEEELLSRLLELFSDKVDASVGEIACNDEFCRAELLGSGQFDLMKRYGRTFAEALDAKGFRFFLTDRYDPENPKVSFYFGRNSSWTVPDFSKLDL
jgi:hypothetical protein